MINWGDNIVYFTPYEIKILEASEVYKRYKTLSWTTITRADIQTDLNWIAKSGIENLPLIKYLTFILEQKSQPTTYTLDNVQAQLITMSGTIYDLFRTANLHNNPHQFTSAIPYQETMLAFGQEVTVQVQAGNAFANVEIGAAVAAKQLYAKRIRFATDNILTPALAAFHFIVSEEDGAALAYINVAQTDMFKWIDLDVFCTTDQKKLYLTCASTEATADSNVYIHLDRGYFT